MVGGLAAAPSLTGGKSWLDGRRAPPCWGKRRCAALAWAVTLLNASGAARLPLPGACSRRSYPLGRRPRSVSRLLQNPPAAARGRAARPPAGLDQLLRGGLDDRRRAHRARLLA